MNLWRRLRKIAHLPGTKLTPEVVLARTQEKLPRIKAVALVILWDDETMSTDFSSISAANLAMAAMVLQEDARQVVIGK